MTADELHIFNILHLGSDTGDGQAHRLALASLKTSKE
jgi:hypothetical protein